MRIREILLSLGALLVAGAGSLAVAVYVTDPRLPTGPVAKSHRSEQAFAEIEYGRYMTTVADCAACHTDPKDGVPFAGGRPIETPFGTVNAPNITPDRDTGIGTWSDDDFANALQKGFSKDGHMLYPAMPYPYYTKMTRRDVDAIRAYLGTVAPVNRKVLADTLPFPLSIRIAMRAWNVLYFREGRFVPDDAHDAVYERGAYLVQGPEHCGACHTPKTPLGGDEPSEVYQGSVIQDWTAPNITGDPRRGVGAWSVDDLVQYLHSGHNRQAAASGPMAEEVDLSSSRMREDDLRAIAVYLKMQPGENDEDRPAASPPPAGAAIYNDSCASCHGVDGKGVQGLFPTLAGAPAVQQHDATSLIRVVINGAKSVATADAPTGASMPAYSWRLDDEQVAAVINYMRTAWGNRAEPVKSKEVGALRERLRRRPD